VKVLIDTNILVSAVLRDRLPEKIIEAIIARPHIQWIVTTAILAEYKSVLARPRFAIPAAELERQFALIDRATQQISVTETFDFPRDRKDAKFLACATAARADYLITGDRDFADAQALIETGILNPGGFARVIDIEN
jgi:putative PIN family toxin of toxin-antitoxin system